MRKFPTITGPEVSQAFGRSVANEEDDAMNATANGHMERAINRNGVTSHLPQSIIGFDLIRGPDAPSEYVKLIDCPFDKNQCQVGTLGRR